MSLPLISMNSEFSPGSSLDTSFVIKICCSQHRHQSWTTEMRIAFSSLWSSQWVPRSQNTRWEWINSSLSSLTSSSDITVPASCNTYSLSIPSCTLYPFLLFLKKLYSPEKTSGNLTKETQKVKFLIFLFLLYNESLFCLEFKEK